MTKQNEPTLIDQAAFWNTLHNQVAGLSDDGQLTARMHVAADRKELVVWSTAGDERRYDLSRFGHVSALNFSPDSRHLIFTEDPAGSENLQLHLLDLQDGQIQRLTDPQDKTEFAQFTSSGRFLFRRSPLLSGWSRGQSPQVEISFTFKLCRV